MEIYHVSNCGLNEMPVSSTSPTEAAKVYAQWNSMKLSPGDEIWVKISSKEYSVESKKREFPWFWNNITYLRYYTKDTYNVYLYTISGVNQITLVYQGTTVEDSRDDDGQMDDLHGGEL